MRLVVSLLIVIFVLLCIVFPEPRPSSPSRIVGPIDSGSGVVDEVVVRVIRG